MKQIRSLHIELPVMVGGCHDDCGYELFCKWGANFGIKLDNVTFLYGTQMIESEMEEESETLMPITSEELISRIHFAINCTRNAMLWQAVLLHVVPKHPMLQEIGITNSHKKGVKLYLSGDKLVEFKNSANLDSLTMLFKLIKPFKLDNLRVYYLLVLCLPTFGYVMNAVTLVNIKFLADDDCDNDTAMLDAFEEEEGVFSEAVVQILANHKNNIKTLFRN